VENPSTNTKAQRAEKRHMQASANYIKLSNKAKAGKSDVNRNNIAHIASTSR